MTKPRPEDVLALLQRVAREGATSLVPRIEALRRHAVMQAKADELAGDLKVLEGKPNALFHANLAKYEGHARELDGLPDVIKAKQGRKSRDEHNATVTAAAKKRHADWQRRADAVWKLHPTWGRPAVAKVIAKDGEKWDTIRKHIDPK